MDPFSPDNGLDSDPIDDPPTLKREPGSAPAGSLMSIQVRRRMPAKDRLLAPLAASVVRPEPVKAFDAPRTPALKASEGLESASAAPVAAQPAAAAPPAPPTAARGEPGRRTPTAAVAAVASAPATPSALASPGIARYARTGENGRRPESKPAPDTSPARAGPPAAAKPAASAPPPPTRPDTPAPTPEAVRPEGIVSYWLLLRGSRRYPSKADLNQQRIAADWPNSILMRCRSGSKVLEPEKVFTGPQQGAAAVPGGESPAVMELSPMMLQWLLTLAADAARDRRPMQDTESFPSLNKSIRYGAFALPFSDDQTRINHVLCHVYWAP